MARHNPKRAHIGRLLLPEWVLGRLLYYAYADEDGATWEAVEAQHAIPARPSLPGARAMGYAKRWAEEEGMCWPPCPIESPKRDPEVTLRALRSR